MAQTIQLKRSASAGNIPGTSDLALGEIAINTADGAVYIKKGNDDIVAVHDNDILHIDTSNARVGMLTTSPSDALHVFGIIRTHTSSTSKYLRMFGGNSGNFLDSYGNTLFIRPNGNSALAVALDTAGNVGIGTTSPSVKFEVNGGADAIAKITGTSTAARLDLATTTHHVFMQVIESDGRFRIYDQTASNEYLTISNAGNVGIGTSSPSEVLTLDDTDPKLALRDAGVERAFLQVDSSNNFVINNKSISSMIFETSDTERMRLSSTGKLGIGTTNPDQKFHVEFANSDTSFSGGSGGAWGSDGIRIENTSGTTNTMAMLHLRNNDSDIHIAGIRQGTNDSDLGFFFEGTEKVRIDSSGNLLIGTTSTTLYSATSGGGVLLDPNGPSTIARESSGTQPCLILNNTGSDGQILQFRQDGAVVGNIGVASDDLNINGGDNHSGIRFQSTGLYPLRNNASANGTIDLGATGQRFKDLYLGGNAIFDDGQITSDGTNFIFDGAAGKEVIISSARDVRIIIDDNNDDTNNEFQIFRHSGGGTKLLNLTQAGALTINEAYTFPTADGSANQVLRTDGSGNLTFATVTSGGGAVDSIANFADNRVITASDADSLNGEANLTFDGTTLDITGNFVIDHGNWTSSDVVNVTTDQFDAGATFQTGEFLLFGDHDGTADKMLSLKRAGTDVFMVNKSGNVGIGTSSPSDKLHVVGDQYLDGDLVVKSSGVGNNISILQSTSGNIVAKMGESAVGHGFLTLFELGVGDVIKFDANANSFINRGNFGIGTASPGAPLEIYAAESTMKFNSSAGRSTEFNQGGGNFHIRTSHSTGVGINFGMSNAGLINLYNNTTAAVSLNANGTSHFNGGNVGIGTTSPTGSLHIVNNAVDGTPSILIEATEDSALAAPQMEFKRHSASPADADYLGQIKFTGENDNDQSVLYAKITGKIQDASDTTEDGIIEFMTKKAGANNISARLKSDKLELINGTSLEVAGNATVTGNLTVNGTTTTLSTATLDVEDKNITLNKGSGDTSGSADGAGITIQDAVDASNDATILWDASSDRFDFSHTLHVPDSTKFISGTGSDFQFFHNGTNSQIINNTGDIIIENAADDKDIKFFCDDGSGGTTSYLQLDGSDTRIAVFKETRFYDNVKAVFGNSADLQIYHDTSNSVITNSTGHLTIQNSADDSDIVFKSDDGSGGVATYFFLDGSNAHTNFQLNARWVDNAKVQIGNSADMQIYHDGSNSWIKNDTGNLQFDAANDIIIDAGGGDIAFRDDSVEFARILNTSGSMTLHAVTQDKDILFRGNDGGSTITALTLDMSDSGKAVFNSAATFGAKVTISGTEDEQLTLNSTDDGAVYMSFERDFDRHAYVGFGGSNDTFYIANEESGGNVQINSGNSTALLLDSNQNAHFYGSIDINDSKRLNIGSSNDLSFIHDGTNTYVQNTTGNLDISNTQDDGDIIFSTDDGSGGITEYLRLDGSLAGSGLTFVRLPDGGNLGFGAANDLRIYHDGSNSTINNFTGDLNIRNDANDGDITLQSDDGSGGVATYLRVDGANTNIAVSKTMVFADNAKASFGAGEDLRIKHNGTSSFIENHTGDLHIAEYTDDGDIIFYSDDGSGDITQYFRLDGGLTKTYFEQNVQFNDNVRLQLGAGADLVLNHNGTNSFIQNKTGDLFIDQEVADKDIKFRGDDGSGGVTEYFMLDGSQAQSRFLRNVKWNDSVNALFGTSDDLQIFHDGSNSYVSQQGTGNLIIRTTVDDGDISLQSDDGSGGLATYFQLDGSQVQNKFLKDTVFLDNVKAKFGTGGDLEIYHDGSNSYIWEKGTGNLILRATDFRLQDSSGNSMAVANSGGGVGLYHNASIKLDTTSYGVAVTGGVNVSSHFEVNGVTVINSARNITNVGVITASGRVQSSGGFMTTINQVSKRHYYIATSSGGGDFFIGQIEHNSGTDGAIEGTLCFAYDYGTTSESPKIHFSFAQRSGTARGNWWYENDDDAAGSNNVKVVLIDDGSGGMFVWVRVSDYAIMSVDTVTRSGGNIPSSGSLTAGTITTGTTLFDTSNDPTAEFHIGKLFAHDDINVPDNKQIQAGAGGDLFMTHNGSNSFIQNKVGGLYIEQATNDGNMLFRNDDGSGGLATYLALEGGNERVSFGKNSIHTDNIKADFGTGSDLRIWHDGTNSNISNGTGDLYITNTANDKDLIFQSEDGSGGVTTYFTVDGSARDVVFNKDIHLNDSVRLLAGTGQDLRITHDGSNATVDNYTGDFLIRQQVDDKDVIIQTDNGSGGQAYYFQADGSSGETKLFYYGSLKISTQGDGVKITGGNITSTGTATSTTATTQTAIHTLSATGHRSARYTVQVTNSTDSTYMISEILMVHDGTTPSITEYGVIFTGAAREAAFTADISSGNIRLLATPASTDTMAFKVVAHSIVT